ncbi:HI0074 family nucleotidyltransferase substrate-binding subunit [Aquifex pyrophilus]
MDLERFVGDFNKALSRLKEAHKRAEELKGSTDYEFFRDSTIQRFEFTVEIMWKSVKRFLETSEGITCRSPKSCIRAFFTAGFISEEEAVKLLKMIDDRNRTSHTYHQEIAESIYRNIKEYIPLMEKVLKILKKTL